MIPPRRGWLEPNSDESSKLRSISRATMSSNPVPSSGESTANLAVAHGSERRWLNGNRNEPCCTRPDPHLGFGVRCSYNAFGTLGRFGFFKGGFIKGRFAQLSHAVLYRRHQLSLHGPSRAALLWLAERINGLVQPTIRIS